MPLKLGTSDINSIKLGETEVTKVYQGETEVYNSDTETWTLVVIPDTQRLAANNATAYNSLIQWIVDNKTTEDIRMVVHLGDLVNNGANSAEWNVAETALDRLHDNNVPWIVAAGNHDYDDDAKGVTYQRAVTNWDAKFPESQWTGKSWYVSSYNNQTQNQAATLTIGTKKYLFLTLELFPRAAVIAWANTQITNENPDRIIVGTHMMVDQYGVHEDDDAVSDTPVTYSICNYSKTADCKSGLELYNDFISQHDNIIVTFNGHDLNTDVDAIYGSNAETLFRRRTDTVNGNTINQHVFNYQNDSSNTYADSAFLRLYKFDHSDNSCDVTTYNPVQDTSNTDGQNQFTINYT